MSKTTQIQHVMIKNCTVQNKSPPEMWIERPMVLFKSQYPMDLMKCSDVRCYVATANRIECDGES